ncbi:MAG: VWA domain-containing protein [Planctomycetota bacterium]
MLVSLGAGAWTTLAAIALIAAIFGLVLRRDDPLRVRLAGLAAVIAALLCARGWQELSAERVPGSLQVIGGGDPAWIRSLEDRCAAAGAGFLRFDGPLDEAAIRAAIAGSPRAQSVLVWREDFEPSDATAISGLVDRAVSAAPAWPVVERAQRFRLTSRAAALRPTGLEVSVDPALLAEPEAASPSAIEVVATLHAPDGELLLDARETADARGVAQFTFLPRHSGEHRLRVATTLRGGRRVVSEALLAVDEPAQVWVVGSGGADVTAALRAQALPVRAVASWKEAGEARSDGDVIILTSAPTAEEREPLLDFVDRGGGLLLVGADDGGAIPTAADPLAAIAPMTRAAVNAAAAGPAGGSTDEARPKDPPSSDEPSPKPSPEPSPPSEPERQPEAKPSPPSPAPTASGDAAGAGAAERRAEATAAEIERKQVALLLLVDCSGSMSQPVEGLGMAEKIELARQSALATAQRLEPEDEIGILGFGAFLHPILPLGPRPDDTVLRAACAQLSAEDPNTLIGPGLRRADEWIRKSKAPVRHVVIITDGELQDPGDALLGQAVARRLGLDGIFVSALLVVPSDEFTRAERLQRIAELGRGRFVQEAEGDSIPRFVSEVTAIALRSAGRVPAPTPSVPEPSPKPPLESPPEPDPKPTPSDPKPPSPPPPQPSKPVPPPSDPNAPPALPLRVVAVSESQWLGPEPEREFPPIARILPVTAAPRAQVVFATIDGTPLLGWQHVGLGRVAAWSSAMSEAAVGAWLADSAFPGLLAGWVEALRAATGPGTAAIRAPSEVREPAGPDARAIDWMKTAAVSRSVDLPEAIEVPTPRRIERTRDRTADLGPMLMLALLGLAILEAIARRQPSPDYS